MKKLIYVLLACFLLVLVGCTRTVTVSFNTDGGAEVASKELNKGEKVELPPLSKEGFEVDGWFFDSEFKKQYTGQTIEEDTKLYVKWKVLTFQVKFVNDDDVQIGSVQTIEYGKGATAPSNPEKVGHSFVRWDKAFNNVKSDLVVKAVYTAKYYTVKFFDHDASQIGSNQEVMHGKAATAPDEPTRTGYTFEGWSVDFSEVTKNLEVHAVYKINTYKVSFKDSEGSIIGEVQDVEHGKAAVAPTAPTKEGFIFSKWDVAFSNITEDITVTAVYQVRTFTVEFRDFEGKRIGTVQTVEYGKAATAPDNPEKTGYEFVKWNLDFTNVKSNLIVKPDYNLVVYSVKYYDNEILLDIKTEFTVEMAPVITTHNKDGFLFVGWYSDAALKDEVKSVAKGTTKDVVLYGKWLDSSQKHTIVYELNGGTWAWESVAVTNPTPGIDAVSNLPEMFMQDFYTYLKDHNLLNSSLVFASLRKTTWAAFSADYDDPYAIYNHTSTNTAQNNDGYSQFFYTTATGNTTTGLITSIEGGFFGTEPYKTKYWNLAQNLAYMTNILYTSNYFWGGASSKSLAGFVLDGYFYGTQGARDGNFLALRKVIPTPTKGYRLSGSTLTEIESTYQVTEYIVGLSAKLASPTRVGYAFIGWFDNEGLTGDAIATIPAGVTPSSKYYAKWKAIE